MQELTELPSSRTAAKVAGAKHYFTGKPCSKGHLARRHLTGTCVECAKVAVKAWEARNPGEWRKRAAAYYARYPERVKANSVKSARKRMGIPDAPYLKPLTCELCERDTTDVQMHLDHDHTTGAFRGWLCNRCNLGLGNLGDTVAGLERALAYLRRVGSS